MILVYYHIFATCIGFPLTQLLSANSCYLISNPQINPDKFDVLSYSLRTIKVTLWWLSLVMVSNEILLGITSRVGIFWTPN